MDGAVPVSVRPRESRKPSLSTASSGIVLDIPWIEAEGEDENQSPPRPIRASSEYPLGGNGFDPPRVHRAHEYEKEH
jgi:hypothetical protein